MITWSPEGQAPLDCPHPLLNTQLRQIQHPLSFSYRSIMCTNFKDPFQECSKFSARGLGWNFEFQVLNDTSHSI